MAWRGSGPSLDNVSSVIISSKNHLFPARQKGPLPSPARKIILNGLKRPNMRLVETAEP